MARKYKLTRPELKRQQDLLRRFTRFLPMLKLKQQQLQMIVRQTRAQLLAAQTALESSESAFRPWAAVLRDRTGVDVAGLSRPVEVRTRVANVAGLKVPVFEGVDFAPISYSLFSTPAWLDRAVVEMREISRRQVEVEVMSRQLAMIERELTRVVQRVNLFEKVKIPECKDAVRRIRIHLGDEMTAGVGRAKIAKSNLTADESTIYPFPVEAEVDLDVHGVPVARIDDDGGNDRGNDGGNDAEATS